MNSFRVAIAQITSTQDLEHNFKQLEICLDKIKAEAQANGKSVDLVCFPENTLFLRLEKGLAPKFSQLAELENSSIQQKINEFGAPVMVTTGLVESGQNFNATILLKPNSKPQVLYRKRNMFDVDVVGAPSVRESEIFAKGQAGFVYEQNGWKFGLTICFDLRFSNLFYEYAQQKVDAILVPSAFLVPTGEAHWHVLLRARAIESQCYVLAPAQGGEHRQGELTRQTYGHTLAVDPWGRVLVDLATSPSIGIVELNREEINKVRGQIPMKR